MNPPALRRQSLGRMFLRQPEPAMAVLALVAMIGIGLVNPAFWSEGNLFSLVRANVIPGIFALGVLLVMISGGIDVSFPAFGIAAMYLVINGMIALPYNGVLLPFAVAIAIGLVLGLANAFFVDNLRMIPLIVTLGTGTAVRGFLLGAVGASQINIDRMPPQLIAVANRSILQSAAHVGLTAMIVPYLALALLVHVLLRHTLAGRGIYAIGGSQEGARRAGFSVRRTTYLVYGTAGALAGFAGLLHGSMIWIANPRDLIGTELDVIAAVVLGGASIFGGSGSVAGTMIGTFIFVLLTNSLILMGIPSTWQRVAVGAIVIAASAATAWRERRQSAGMPA